MPNGPFQRVRRFLAELKRRNVYRVTGTYAVVAFVVWQAASMLFPALQFPAWTLDFVVILTLLGIPIALVVAWAFEMMPEGGRRTPDAELEEEPLPEKKARTRIAYKVLIGLGLLAAAVAGGWDLTGGGGETSGASEAGIPSTDPISVTIDARLLLRAVPIPVNRTCSDRCYG